MTLKVSQARLLEVFEYRDGQLFWKLKVSAKVVVGTRAGGPCNSYWRVRVDGVYLYEHQAIFLMFYGWLPDMLDHDNRDKRDNHIENLVSSNYTHNGNNRGATRVSQTGIKGVFPSGNKFMVKRVLQGKQVYLGTFDTLEEAAAMSAQHK